MNRLTVENEFRAGLKEILDAIDRLEKPGEMNPYAGAGSEVFHEHDTRIFFFDQLMRALGWELGPGGNVSEEARIKEDTTRFVDYLGVNDETRAPALILEAKSWDKPMISGKGRHRGQSVANLIVAAIEHINAGKEREASPVTLEWYDNLLQVADYVRMFKEQHGHEIPCAVLSSGQWLLIFNAPVRTFCDRSVNHEQFLLLERADYVANADRIFKYMARVALADTAPVTIRSSQLGNYVNETNITAAYHGMLIHYETSGTRLFDPKPRILYYPSVIVQRDDGAIFTVIDTDIAIELPTRTGDDEGEPLGLHVDEVSAASQTLLAACSSELDIELEPKPLEEFSGFGEGKVLPQLGLALGSDKKQYLRPVRTSADNWIAVTGRHSHYLQPASPVPCQFHTWSACKALDKAQGQNPVSSRTIEPPRAFFVDGQVHHCAHVTVLDRRHDRCHLKAIDARVCCKACIYHDTCWSETEANKLPCGR